MTYYFHSTCIKYFLQRHIFTSIYKVFCCFQIFLLCLLCLQSDGAVIGDGCTVNGNCTYNNGKCVDSICGCVATHYKHVDTSIGNEVCQLSKFHSINWLFIVDFESTFVANVRFCHHKTSNVRQSVI